MASIDIATGANSIYHSMKRDYEEFYCTCLSVVDRLVVKAMKRSFDESLTFTDSTILMTDDYVVRMNKK